eukprot:TRINITY_DN13617_c0_g1_i1.p1 TRINITY_DN13617_c0_g1~~TRINITY_DN13617_c0_g1_i1.p1  ORF type:complete len:153 (-),score=21.73 TRINITY_DN13617_c0_g1_i1:22-423(-)
MSTSYRLTIDSISQAKLSINDDPRTFSLTVTSSENNMTSTVTYSGFYEIEDDDTLNLAINDSLVEACCDDVRGDREMVDNPANRILITSEDGERLLSNSLWYIEVNSDEGCCYVKELDAQGVQSGLSFVLCDD